ncbi:MAG: Transcriptional regulatory protein sin3 [Bogoriella megaspora]|nr:MAG: Transcriptional regulatory protein sin3 [Bogoriella megaspora]
MSREWPPPSGPAPGGVHQSSEQASGSAGRQIPSFGSVTPGQNQQSSSGPVLPPPSAPMFSGGNQQTGPSLPTLQGLTQQSPNLTNRPPPNSEGPPGSQHPVQQQSSGQGPGYVLPNITEAVQGRAQGQAEFERDRELRERELRERERDRQFQEESAMREREQQQRERDLRQQEQGLQHQTHAGSIPLHQPHAVAPQIRSAIHGPNGLLANVGPGPASSSASTISASGGPGSIFSGGPVQQNEGPQRMQMTQSQQQALMPFAGGPGVQAGAVGMGQGQQPILNVGLTRDLPPLQFHAEFPQQDALSYLDQVKVQFVDSPDVYNKFLDIMKDFKSGAIDTPGVIQRVSNLFAGNPNLIQGFNTFLPPGYRIECGVGEDPNYIRVTTPMGTTVSTLPAPRPLSPQGPAASSTASGDAQFYDTPNRGPSGAWAQQSEADTREQQMAATSAAIAHQQEQRGVSQLQNAASAAAGGALAGPGIQRLSPSGRAITPQPQNLNGIGPDGQPGAGLEKRGPVEFNHAISYVNKIKNRFASQPDIYKQFLEILQTYQRESKPIQDVYAQVTHLFSSAPDLLEDFKQFLPESAAHARAQAARQAASGVMPEDVTMLSNLRDPVFPQSRTPQMPRNDQPKLPPMGNFAPTPSANKDNKRKRGAERQTTVASSSTVTAAPDTGPSFGGRGGPGSSGNANKRTKYQHGGKMPEQREMANVSPSLVPALPEPLPPTTTSAATQEELGFFDKVKKFIGNKNTMVEFLKLCNLYSQDLISKGELCNRAQSYIGGNPELMSYFRRFMNFDEKDTIVENRPRIMADRASLPNCRGLGPSYRLLPKRKDSARALGAKRRAAEAEERAPKRRRLRSAPLRSASLWSASLRPQVLALKAEYQKQCFPSSKFEPPESNCRGSFEEEPPICTSGVASTAPWKSRTEKQWEKIINCAEIRNAKCDLPIWVPQKPHDDDDEVPALPTEQLFSYVRFKQDANRISQEKMKVCSGRDELCHSVLNDDWASHPTWASEDSGFVAHRKNASEESLHKIEEERHDYDFNIEALGRTVQLLYPFAVQIKDMNEADRKSFRLPEGLGSQSTTIHKRVIKKMYGREKGQIVCDGLFHEPHTVVPLLVTRLQSKHEEWKGAQREWEKIWRDTTNKSFWKSLDHQHFALKTGDKKPFLIKTLTADMTVRWEEQQRHRLSQYQSVPTYQLDYYHTDADVILDVCSLLIRYLKVKEQGDVAAPIALVKELLPLYLGLDSKEFQQSLGRRRASLSPTGENEDSSPAPDDTSSRARKTNGKKDDLRRGVLERGRSGRPARREKEDSAAASSRGSSPDVTSGIDDDITAANGPEPKAEPVDDVGPEKWVEHPIEGNAFNMRNIRPEEPYNRESYHLYANEIIYSFFRLFFTLYDRLKQLKDSEQEVHKIVDRAMEPKPAIDLHMIDKLPTDWFYEVGPNANYYFQVLRMMHETIPNEMDTSHLEETLRRYYLQMGYQLYHLNGTNGHLAHLAKYAKEMSPGDNNNKDRSSDILQFFKKDRVREQTTHQDELNYRRQVEKCVKEKDIYRFTFYPSTSRSEVQIFKKDDATFDVDSLDEANRWAYYISSFTSIIPTEGVGPTDVVVMQRNLPDLSDHSAGGNVASPHDNVSMDPADNADALASAQHNELAQRFDNVKGKEKLEMRICTRTYTPLFAPHGEDMSFNPTAFAPHSVVRPTTENAENGVTVGQKDNEVADGEGEGLEAAKEEMRGKLIMNNAWMKGLSKEQVEAGIEEYYNFTKAPANVEAASDNDMVDA